MVLAHAHPIIICTLFNTWSSLRCAPIRQNAFYLAGPPQSFTCELQCPDTYHPGTSDQCTIMWERLPTVSCDSLQFSVSLKQSDGTLVYSNFFGRSVYSAVTTTLNQNTVYTATIAAENLCGMANCTATNSTAVEGKNTAGVF